MSSRLFKTKMAMTNRPPMYPELLITQGAGASYPYYDFYKYTQDGVFTPARLISDNGALVVTAVAARDDGKFLVACFGGSVGLYKRVNGTLVRMTVTGTPAGLSITHLEFTRDNQYIIGLGFGSSGTIQLYMKVAADDSTYTIVTGSPYYIPSFGTALREFVISKTGKYLATASSAASPWFNLYKWNGSTGYTVNLGPVNGYSGYSYTGVDISPDEQYAAASIAANTGNLHIVQINADDSTTSVFKASGSGLMQANSVRFSPDGAHLVLGGYVSPFLIIYKFNAGVLTPLTGLPAFSMKVQRIRYSADGRFLALVGAPFTSGVDPSVVILQRVGDTYSIVAQLEAGTNASHSDVAWGPAPQ